MAASCWENAPERFLLAKAYHEVAAVIGWNRAVDFGMRVWEEKRPPSRRRSGAVRGQQGVIYIPSKVTDTAGQELVRLAGDEDASRLAKAFAGLTLAFPRILPASMPRRNRAITSMVAEGRSIGVVATLFDITERQVRRIIAAERIPG